MDLLERLNDQARQVMSDAELEAKTRYHEYVGTEHILLALMVDIVGAHFEVFRSLDIDFADVSSAVSRLLKDGPHGVNKENLPLTPRGKKVIEYAIEEARNLNHDYVGPEHLLLGLIREQDGVAAQVLMNLNLRLEDLRTRVVEKVGRETGKVTRVIVEIDFSPTVEWTQAERMTVAREIAQGLVESVLRTPKDLNSSSILEVAKRIFLVLSGNTASLEEKRRYILKG